MTGLATAWAGRLRRYGLTPAAYRRIALRQGGKCAICKRRPKTKRLAVDHDHVSGRVRGLLCFQCNKFLVGRHRTGALLRTAAKYVDSKFDGRRLVKGTAR